MDGCAVLHLLSDVVSLSNEARPTRHLLLHKTTHSQTHHRPPQSFNGEVYVVWPMKCSDSQVRPCRPWRKGIRGHGGHHPLWKADKDMFEKMEVGKVRNRGFSGEKDRGVGKVRCTFISTRRTTRS